MDLFDRLCAYVERYDKKHIGTLKKARIFEFENIIRDSYKLTPKETQAAKDDLRMPYSTMAITDGHALGILKQVEDGFGFNSRREFINVTVPSDKGNYYTNPDDHVGARDMVMISFGIIENLEFEVVERLTTKDIEKSGVLKLWPTFHLNKLVLAHTDGSPPDIIHDGPDDDPNVIEEYKDLHFGAGFQAGLYLSLLCYFNSPKYFVLETSKKTIRSRKKIPRSRERPKYTISTPKAIRQKLGWDTMEGSPKIAHERMGHWRHFRSDRYVNLQGKKRWINSFWIGQSEAKVGNKRYRVILDRE